MTEYNNSRGPVQQLLARWGFAAGASDDLTEHAELCVQYAGHDISDLAVALRLATAQQVQEALASKPVNVLALEHLSQVIPSLREQAVRLQAIVRGIPFLSGVNDQYVDATADLPGPARSRLYELNAAGLRTSDGQFMAVFSDVANLLAFSQEGRLERGRDALRAALSQEPQLGLAPPMVVARTSRSDASNEAVRVVSSSAQDNFWTPSMAKTEGERVLARLLDEALTRRATDLEIAPMRDGTARLRLRIYGDLMRPEQHAVLSPELNKEITNFLVSRSRAGDGGRLRKSADGQMVYKNSQIEVFLRASFIPADRFGQDFDMISTSLRLLPRTTRDISLHELNLGDLVNQEVHKALIRSQGLIIVAGPTNSGKSTTVAGIVGEHFKLYGDSKKRLSLENPVERYLNGITQISVEDNFSEVMRAMLRHDPDLLWIGEMRDEESASVCVRAATSGHVALSTLHANNTILAFRAVANYLSQGRGGSAGGGASLFDLAESVSLLISQRLVRHVCPHCGQPHAVTPPEQALVRSYLESEGQAHLWERAERILRSKGVVKAKKDGCRECNGLGYSAELPVNELLPVTREVRELLSRSETKLDYSALAKHRVCTLSESALALLEQGKTELSSLFI